MSRLLFSIVFVALILLKDALYIEILFQKMLVRLTYVKSLMVMSQSSKCINIIPLIIFSGVISLVPTGVSRFSRCHRKIYSLRVGFPLCSICSFSR